MKRPVIVLLALILLLSCSSLAAGAPEDPVTILFTHDTHSHFLPSPEAGGGQSGGYTRLYTLLERQRAAAPGPVITLDGGDFSMGTLFQTVYTTEAAELRMLGAMGYDVTTFGNHEYDFRAQGLADMLNAAVDSGGPLPAIVQGNYRPLTARNADPDAEISDETLAASAAAQAALDRYGVTDYVVIERGGVRFAHGARWRDFLRGGAHCGAAVSGCARLSAGRAPLGGTRGRAAAAGAGVISVHHSGHAAGRGHGRGRGGQSARSGVCRL